MKTRKWIIYTVYGILITLAFLYLRFPSDSAGRYIRSIVAGSNPNIVLSFDSVRPSFPPGIRLHNLSVGFKGNPDSVLGANVVKVRPALSGLLFGKLSLLLHADTYEGNMRADIHFKNRFSTKGPVSIQNEFHNISLGKCSFIKAAAGRRVDGRLSGSLAYDGEWGRATSGTGSAKFTLLDGNIQLLKSLFGFDALVFDTVETKLTLKNQTLEIIGLDIAGEQLRGSFTGNLFLNRDIIQSRLAIKGDIEIPALDRKFSTTLKGTVAKPIPRFE